jgi:hypothetical protein
MTILVLLIVQLAATLAGFALVWRWFAALNAELARLREAVEATQNASNSAHSLWPAPIPARKAPQPALALLAAAASGLLRRAPTDDFEPTLPLFDLDRPRRRRGGDAPPVMPIDEIEGSTDWRTPHASVSPETVRAVAAAGALAAPALGFAFAAPMAGIVAAALAVASALLLVSLRPAWRHTAWFAVLGGGAWTLAGYLTGLGAARADIFCAALVLAAAAGLAHARVKRPAAPGVTSALFMAAAALAIGAQWGMVGPAGIAYAVIVALGAAIGASTLRLEPLHLASFAGAGLGLFVLSSQAPAGVWFTPAAVWAGVWFLAISFLRTPALGPRGTLVAATGAAAPMFAVSALYAARHALETPLAAAAGFVTLGLVFVGILVLAARRAKSLEALHLTLWALAAPTLGSAATALLLASPAPGQAACMAALALALVAVDARWPDRVWRFGAVAMTAAAAIVGWNAAKGFGTFAFEQPLWAVTGFTLALPAAFLGIGAHFAARRAPITAAILEAFAIVGAVATLAALTRLAFSGGAPDLQPVGFVEAGTHAALWLGASLLLAWRRDRGAGLVRRGAAIALAGAGLGVALACLLAWLTPWWTIELYAPPFLHPPLGFAAPAVAAWAHWAYWRKRGTPNRARVSFGAATLLTAAWATLEAVWFRSGGADWISVAVGASAFAIAAGVNFVPGLAAPRTV